MSLYEFHFEKSSLKAILYLIWTPNCGEPDCLPSKFNLAEINGIYYLIRDSSPKPQLQRRMRSMTLLLH